MSDQPIRDFEVAPAPKAGMIGRLFGRVPRETAFVEVRNILATTPFEQVRESDIAGAQEPKCWERCFCKEVGCQGTWVLRPDLDFPTFLSSFANLWVRGSSAFKQDVNDCRSQANGRWASGIRLLCEIKKRWCNWDGDGNSLPSLVSEIRHCYFCDESFNRIRPVVQAIVGIADDSTGVYTSKLISQLFYDIAVPFDTASAAKQSKFRYYPESYGGGKMRQQAQAWLLANKKSIDDFRRLDDAPTSCWFEKDRRLHENHGAPCSRVLDKLFYA